MSVSEAAPPNPYIGPRSFQTGETLYGRDREIRELLGLLIAERIVLLHSPSGAGKTSLVQAALIPRLQEQDFTVLPVMRISLDPPTISSEFSVLSSELSGASPNSELKTQNSKLISSELSGASPNSQLTTHNSKLKNAEFAEASPNSKLKTQNSKLNRYI
ncbi:MAG: hypothetical protein ACJ8CR_17155, partial [Roseiflexaceae bacterium]